MCHWRTCTRATIQEAFQAKHTHQRPAVVTMLSRTPMSQIVSGQTSTGRNGKRWRRRGKRGEKAPPSQLSGDKNIASFRSPSESNRSRHCLVTLSANTIFHQIIAKAYDPHISIMLLRPTCAQVIALSAHSRIHCESTALSQSRRV